MLLKARTMPPKPKQTRKAKEPGRYVGAKELRELANELRARAKTIDQYAHGIDECQLPAVKALMGNWKDGLKNIDNFLGTQILAKFVSKASAAGYQAHHVLRKFIDEE